MYTYLHVAIDNSIGNPWASYFWSGWWTWRLRQTGGLTAGPTHVNLTNIKSELHLSSRRIDCAGYRRGLQFQSRSAGEYPFILGLGFPNGDNEYLQNVTPVPLTVFTMTQPRNQIKVSSSPPGKATSIAPLHYEILDVHGQKLPELINHQNLSASSLAMDLAILPV